VATPRKELTMVPGRRVFVVLFYVAVGALYESLVWFGWRTWLRKYIAQVAAVDRAAQCANYNSSDPGARQRERARDRHGGPTLQAHEHLSVIDTRP